MPKLRVLSSSFKKIEKHCFFPLASHMISTFSQITQKPLLLRPFWCHPYPLSRPFRSFCTLCGALNSKKWKFYHFWLGAWERLPKKGKKSNFSTSESRGSFWAASWDHNEWNKSSNSLPQSSSHFWKKLQGFDRTISCIRFISFLLSHYDWVYDNSSH